MNWNTRMLAVPLIVWGTWLAVMLVDMWFVARHGLRIPYWDDWNYIPVAAGQLPITPEWLWSFQMDHRIPLPRLVFVALYRLSGQDVRVVMLVNAAILSMAAILGLLVARRRFGRTRLTDAVLPLTLAGIANYQNLLSAAQIQYILSIGLFGLAVYFILRHPVWFRFSNIALLAACVLCLPLTGSTGLALALPIMTLLPVGAWIHRRSREPGVRLACWLALLLTVVSLAIVTGYNVFEDRPASPPATPPRLAHNRF